MRYLPHTPTEIEEMLERIGAQSLDQLFETIPQQARFEKSLNVPPALAEPELMRQLSELAAANEGCEYLSFLGAGAYRHHMPPALDQLLLRSEFYTAYTPYQPEVAQGTLQAIWEFQTIVSELFGLPLANASLYDGASAAAEATQMARRLTRRDKVLVSECVHPDYRNTIKTYTSGQAAPEYRELALGPDASIDAEALRQSLDDNTAAVVVGYPSFFGTLSDLRAVAARVHERGALLITCTAEPYALALAEPPGALGADIAVGEGQALACPPQFGGPGVGLFACRDQRTFLQQLPGRVCGETVDVNGQRGYVLTLATREQHIRRERATSNICTNQGLLALALAIRTSLLGRRGFVEVAQHCLSKAEYLRSAIQKLPGYELAFPEAAYFNEFAVRVQNHTAQQVCAKLETQGILAGLDVGRYFSRYSDLLLVSVVETHSRADLDRFVQALSTV